MLEEWQPEAPACTSSHSPRKSHAPLQLAQVVAVDDDVDLEVDVLDEVELAVDDNVLRLVIEEVDLVELVLVLRLVPPPLHHCRVYTWCMPAAQPWTRTYEWSYFVNPQ